MAGKPKLIKICLTNQGEDSETPWAYDLGPVPGGRKVRLANVPFMHAKPTWGDTIIVTPPRDEDDDAFPTWDRDGVPWSDVGSRIEVDGGHWAMILDYAPHPREGDAFGALARACAAEQIICEGAWAAEDGRPGRAYLAVPSALSDVDVIEALRAASLPCELMQIHPEPPQKTSAKKRAPKKKAPAKKRVVTTKPAATKKRR